MRRFFGSAALALALSGCTSTVELYRMTPADGWGEQASGCSGPLGLFFKELDDGVTMSVAVTPYPLRKTTDSQFRFAFRLDNGKSVRLLDTDISIELADGTVMSRRIETFRNGDQTVAADILLVGEKGNGYPEAVGADQTRSGDVFHSSVQISPTPLSFVKIIFPKMEVNGKTTTVGQKTFAKASARFVQCLQ